MAKLPTRAENYSERYNQLIQHADLAENSPVRGCMTIKPHGYAIWENMQAVLDKMFKHTGHRNAYFPLLLPKSFLDKEEQHAEGFAKECAVVTHHRLKINNEGKIDIDPEAKLEEPLIIRPTSETMIWSTYKNRIHSYRDLPLLINQRANVMRRELRTRPFLRTSEFLRQEGHTAHATAQEAKDEARQMLDVYYDFMKNFLAIDPIIGEKTAHERFAGAEITYTLEAMMQDKKALQSGTSHFLGQNFAKAFDVQFTNDNNELEHVWATSRGVSTRLMGGLIMSHSDDQGLVLPPAIAPLHMVIVPIFKSADDLDAIKKYIQPITDKLNNMQWSVDSKYFNANIDIHWKLDDDPQKSPGWKFNEWELKGVPIRVAVGKRDIENNTIEISQRHSSDKESMSIDAFVDSIEDMLSAMQHTILKNNQNFVKNHTYTVDNYADFKTKITQGFVLAHRDGSTEIEQKIQEETKATIRCIPFDDNPETGKCIYTGKESTQRVLFARAY